MQKFFSCTFWAGKKTLTQAQWWTYGWGSKTSLKSGPFDDVIILSQP